MGYDLDEQENLAALKAWWQRYGNLVTGVVMVVALMVLGLNGYNAWQANQSAKASVLYDQMERALAAKNTTLIKETTATLLDQYGRTAYAQMAALEAAHANAEAGDLKSAQAQLQWAVAHARDDQYRALARLSLASVELQQGQGDAALTTLSGPVPEQFASAFADRRGDIYLAQNRISDARTQYQQAIDHLKAVGPDLQVAFTNVETLKLDALASATGAAASAASAAPSPPLAAASPPAAALAPVEPSAAAPAEKK